MADTSSVPIYPPVAFYFGVLIGGQTGKSNAAFQEATGIGPEMQVESYSEGGENRFVHSLPKGVKHPKLSLKRGVAAYDSPLATWCRSVLEGGLSQRITVQDVSLYLYDEQGSPLRKWSFQKAFPSSWKVDAFQADKNSIAIETVELTYTTSTRLL
jgi:phage tail-like protein